MFTKEDKFWDEFYVILSKIVLLFLSQKVIMDFWFLLHSIMLVKSHKIPEIETHYY